MQSHLGPRRKRRKENKGKERCELWAGTKMKVKEESGMRTCTAECIEIEQGKEDTRLDQIL